MVDLVTAKQMYAIFDCVRPRGAVSRDALWGPVESVPAGKMFIWRAEWGSARRICSGSENSWWGQFGTARTGTWSQVHMHAMTTMAGRANIHERPHVRGSWSCPTDTMSDNVLQAHTWGGRQHRRNPHARTHTTHATATSECRHSGACSTCTNGCSTVCAPLHQQRGCSVALRTQRSMHGCAPGCST